ncbi:MAG: FtsX-like permease family protein [Deltaproteobacteria bacterium]|nr:FtsX-like permease family protein [Deltaproteobacteria bacterium]
MVVLKILIRNAFRNRLRTILTIFGVAIAILSFGLLRTVVSAWYAGADASSATRLVTRNAISIIFTLPLSYKDKIRQVEGVKIVSWGNWFGAYYIDEKNFFANFCVEPVSYLELYPEFVLSQDARRAFMNDRKGCIAGRKLADKFKWKVGDNIPLKGTIYPGTWDFVLRGIYKGRDKTIDETQFFFHWDYLNETLRKTVPGRADQVGFYMVGVSRPDLATDVSTSIDGMFKNSYAETLTETEKAFNLGFIAMTDAILMVIQVVSLLIIIIIMAVVANTMAMTTRERIRDYAIMKTLGFGGGVIAALIFGESLVITLVGCGVGILLTFPVAGIFGQKLAILFPVFNVSAQTVYLDVLAAVIVALAAAVIPTRRAIRIRIAEGLRRVG